MNKTFALNGKVYETDAKTLKVLRSIIASDNCNDGTVVQAMTIWLSCGKCGILGEQTGRISEIDYSTNGNF